MSFPKFCSPFPPLDLTHADKKELAQITKRIVGEVVDGYERFLYQDHGRLNPTRWEVIRERDDVRVYYDRRSGDDKDTKDLHALLTIGTVVGTLEDAMYGVLNHTTDAMRLKTAYVQDTLANCAVLATIQEPKPDKPFRSMMVKWMVKTVPLHARLILRHRDFVYIEATGMKTLSNGEPIGFQLLHSVDFPQTRPFPNYVRAGMSVCSIWRQSTPERAQAYVKTFFDAPEKILAPLLVRSGADAVVSVWRFMHCAQMKKLAWLMRRRAAGFEDKGTSSAAAANNNNGGSGGCAVCNSQSSSARQGTKSTCAICRRAVCSSCRLKRELFAIDRDNALEKRRVVVCIPCITVAVRSRAEEVAREELVADATPQHHVAALLRVPGAGSSSMLTSGGPGGGGSSVRASEPVTQDGKRRSMTLSSSGSAHGPTAAQTLHSTGSGRIGWSS